MNLLINSHVLIWYNSGDRRLGPSFVNQLRQRNTDVYVSAATIWELAIKRAAGKLTITGSIVAVAANNGFKLLPVLPEHAELVSELERHHGDPFDRLLVAQAMHEGLTLVTHDRALALYGIPVLLV